MKNVDVHHMSWTFIVTEALILLNNKSVASPDQAYILSELIRYLQHDSEIINPFKRMPRVVERTLFELSAGVAYFQNFPPRP